MLRLINIKKDYVLKGVETVHALRGISLNFRRNEFVAILGPSGCGKTTFLNIIGGLDRYTDGDLIIEGKSTKEFKDRDWDTYRNHSIGFVFQSYNLIMHQTVLKNVELALTISGVKKAERKERAIEVLKKVGLEGYEKKRPNQLSGGQMQRVAIARSLINNPEILLADEPTGALDTETSIQIMDLLKEVAKDRLVIMVTHNPDLANRYATRIVSMLDGVINNDTNPYDGESEEERAKAHEAMEVTKGSKKNSSMSFPTATGLSFSNLLSKLRRTILVSIAGSIGIIGVSAVLSVSYGVRHYIDSMQSDMLSAYPLNISETNVDYTSLMTGLSNWDDAAAINFDITTSVGLDSMINYLMDKYKDITSVKTNEINLELMDYIENAPEGSVSAIDYDYGLDMTNNIFSKWKRHEDSTPEYVSLNGLTQMYISELKTVNGFAEYAMFVDLFTNFMEQLPADHDYIMKQYDLIGEGSRFPEKDNELVIVVDNNQTMTDFLLAQLGYYSEDEFLNIAKRAIEENKDEPDQDLINSLTYPESFTFDEILNKEFVYYPHDTIWDYKEIERTYVKTTFDFMGYDFAFNVYYHENSDTLEGKLVVNNKTSLDLIMNRQGTVTDPTKPYLGTWVFSYGDMDLPFTIAADGNVYYYSPTFDANGNITGVEMKSQPYTTENKTISGYMYPGFADTASWESTKKEMKIVGILKPKQGLRFGSLSRGIYYTKDFTQSVMSDARDSQIINNDTHGFKKHMLDYLTTYVDDM